MKIVYCNYEMPVLNEDAARILAERLPECEIECCGYQNDGALREKLRTADGFLTANVTINAGMLECASRLKVISVDATGYGNIDVKAAHEKGILVCSIGAYCTDEVADHGMMLILMLEKRAKQYMKLVEEAHIYNYKALLPPRRLAGKRLAVFGYGRIGQALAKRAAAFGYEVAAVPHNPELIGKYCGTVRYISKEEAFATADVISNNMSETPDNYEFFNRAAFCQMKKQPLFINLGRGSAVSESDLYEALTTGRLSGAGLDVLKEARPDLSQCPLLGLDNVIITPHSAFYSAESMASVRLLPIQNLINGLQQNTAAISNIAK